MPEDKPNFREQSGLQPYYKLHGSADWTDGPGSDGRLIIMGGEKSTQINQFPLLTWYHRQFRDYLSRARRLMIIGYSFGDNHINSAITDAVKRDDIQIFIVDPCGVDVIKCNTELMDAVKPRIIGASRRDFRSAFAMDRVEFTRLSRFFQY